MARAVLHLGTNEGFREINLELARLLISNFVGVIISCSCIYKTAAWGKTDQADFQNQALICETSLSAKALLTQIHEIEYKLGRKRKERWGPRLMDIDIIFLGTEIIDTEGLKIPHAEFRNRNFVLVPLLEICPDLVDPVTGLSIHEISKACTDHSRVEVL